jgi:hypothetical protein
MRIISQYKDYYDYLSGVYGVDEKIVLDRRNFNKTPYLLQEEKKKIILFICDMVYEGYFSNGRYYWGTTLLELLTPDELEKWNNQKEKYKNYINLITNPKKYWDNSISISLIPVEAKIKHNTIKNCPILMPTNAMQNDFLNFPILKDLGVASILPPKEIYLLLTAWLAPKDNHVDTRTNKDKIVGAGFDLKTSFRNM